MNIKDIVEKLCKDMGTKDPFEIAERMDIQVHYLPLNEIRGIYLKAYGVMQVAINCDLPLQIKKFVMAHEIGHAILHPDVNSLVFKTCMLNTGRQEVEANMFAIHMLLPNKDIEDNPQYTVDNWASILGLPREIIEMRFNYEMCIVC